MAAAAVHKPDERIQPPHAPMLCAKNPVISPITYLVYLGIVISRAKGVSVGEVAYVRPLIWTLVATIAAVIVSRIGRDYLAEGRGAFPG